MGTRMASLSSRNSRRIIACTPWLAPSVRYRKSGLQGKPSLSSMPCSSRACQVSHAEKSGIVFAPREQAYHFMQRQACAATQVQLP